MVSCQEIGVYTSLVAFVWAFVIMFSEEAYGEKLLESLHQNYWAKTSLKIAAGMSLFLYLFDVEMWEGMCGKIWRCLMLGALGFFVFLAVIFQAGERPSAPISIFALALPVCVIILRQSLLKEKDMDLALRTINVGLIVAAATTFMLWVGWIFWDPITHHNNFWSTAYKKSVTDEEGLDCNDPDDAELCESALLLWGAPALFAMIAGLMATVTGLLALALVPAWDEKKKAKITAMRIFSRTASSSSKATGEALSATGDALAKSAKDAGDAIAAHPAVKEADKAIKEAGDKVSKAVDPALKSTADAFAKSGDAIAGHPAVKSAGAAVDGALKSTSEAMGGVLKSTGEALAETSGRVAAARKSFLEAVENSDPAKARREQEAAAAKEQQRVAAALKMLKGLAYAGIFVFIVLYCVSRLVGSNMGIDRSLYDLCGTAFVGIAILFVMAVGWDAITKAASPMLTIVRTYLRNGWVQSMLVFFGAPVYPLYLLLSLVNQLIRRVTCRLKPGEKGFLLTPAARVTLAELREWEWAGVLIKMCYMGLIFWWGLVFTLPTYMLLSSVREWLIAQGGCGLASGIIFLIGAVLFLLPPVPGAAIYLVGGMILPDEQICGKTFADDEATGFWTALVWSMFIFFVMKLAAHVIQQKVFGEGLGSYTSVLQMVAINSEMMKSIRFTLEKPGLDFGKVCILCAGPDWPTSVLCGILKLSIWETLLGLTPVVIPAIIPITLASALSQRAAVTGSQSLESWAEVTTFIMLAIQIVSYMGIVAITDNVLKNHKAELAQYEDNQEVLKLDRKAEADAADFKAATELATMPGGMKFLLYSATACCWTAGFMQLALMDYSFEAFEVTDPVSEVLCLSCDKAVVKPMGWFSIGAMCVGTVALVLFNQAGSARVAKMAGGGAAAMI